MAIFVKTDTPAKLVREIKEYIDDKKITTWTYDKDGDFTHDTDQWRFHAWIRASIEENRVVFGIIGRNDRDLTIVDYAIYHGRFVEMLLTNFDKLCDEIKVSPLATPHYDSVKAGKI